MTKNYLQWLSQKMLNVAALIVSTLAFLDAFFPLAEGERVNAAVFHLSGLPWLLYFLPLVTIAVSVLALYRRIVSTGWWYMIVGGIGLLIAMFSILSCMNSVDFIEGESSATTAGILLMVYYVAVIGVGVVAKLGERIGVHESANEPRRDVHTSTAAADGGFPALSPEFAPVSPTAMPVSNADRREAPAASQRVPNIDTARLESFEPEMRKEDALAFTSNDYYVQRWEPLMRRTPGSVGFNVWAFFFSTEWCFLRKLYVAGLIMLAADLLFPIAFAFNVGLALVVFNVPDQYEPKGVTLSVLLAVATYVMVHIPFGLYANRLLFNRARAEIKRVDALELSDADRDIAIRKRGGKNFPAMWLALVLCTVMFVLFR